MEEKTCTNCNVSKTGEEFNGMNKQCIKCLNKNKEFQKTYSQKEVFCDICLCKVKQCRVSKHLKTDKHINNKKRKEEEEAKQKEMNEYMKDDEARIEALQKIWKTVGPYNFKRL